MSLLARHEAGVWNEAQQIASGAAQGVNRSVGFNIHILPHCRQLVEAAGQRMAYEAAENNVTSEVLAAFEANCIAADPSWYCEKEGMKRENIFTQQAVTTEAILPQIEIFLQSFRAAHWANAPILKTTEWEDFVNNLRVFRGEEIGWVKSQL